MRPLAAAAMTTAIALSLVACGGSKEERAAKRDGVALTGVSGANDAGVKVTAKVTKERAKALYITMNIVNGGTKTVVFTNPESERVPGFKVAADGHEPQGADAGKMAATKSHAARLQTLAPGAEAEFEVKWTFEPPLAHETYPWTFTLSNMFVNDQKVGDVTLTYSPTP